MKLRLKEMIWLLVIVVVSLLAIMLSSCQSTLQNVFIGIFTGSLVVLVLSIIGYRHEQDELSKALFQEACNIYGKIVSLNYVPDFLELYIGDKLQTNKGHFPHGKTPFHVVEECSNEYQRSISNFHAIFSRYINPNVLAFTILDSRIGKLFSTPKLNAAKGYVAVRIKNDPFYIYFLEFSQKLLPFNSIKYGDIRRQWDEIVFVSLILLNYNKQDSSCEKEILCSSQCNMSELQNEKNEIEANLKKFREKNEKMINQLKNDLADCKLSTAELVTELENLLEKLAKIYDMVPLWEVTKKNVADIIEQSKRTSSVAP